jgi:lycopene beta-cyclase
MDQLQRFDYIIAGAGASGLSLLWQLLHSDDESIRSSSILLADRTLKPTSDKTWCFWDDSRIPFPDLIHHTWHTLEVSAKESTFTEELDKYRYHCIRSIDFSEKLLDLARNRPNVTLLETDIHGFKPDGDSAIMETGNGGYRAKWIFQSALKPPGYFRSKSDITLMQHFLGWEIEMKSPVFDPGKAVLMDFDVPQGNGVSFIYLLPYSETTALIEYTLFSPTIISDEEYEAGLRFYLHEKMKLDPDQYTITRTEKGVIPMEDQRYPPLFCERVVNTGTMGGLTKPSTGYTFTRIQRQVRHIVKDLERGNEPVHSGESDYRFRVYDMMLLWLLREHPDTSINIFRELFRRNRFDRIFTFLEEDTSFPQELKIFSSLPYMPFFRSIWHMKHRIFTGA